MPGPAPTLAGRAGARVGLLTSALGAGLRGQILAEWRGTPIHLWLLSRPNAEGFAIAPRDPRPADRAAGQELLAGVFKLGEQVLRLPPDGDPWNLPSPSRRFAARLHQFDWLRDLLNAGEPGIVAALRLTLEWRRVFGRWNEFAWSPDILERRVLNLACAGRAMAAAASDAEAASLANALGRQARQLLALSADDERRAERLAAAGVAGSVLAGIAGDRLIRAVLKRLDLALEQTVLPDGGHASRSPEAGLELLFDLLTLDEGLSQRGYPPPESLSRAIDRLTAALRFFTLADGRLACFQGGSPSTPARIASARTAAASAHDEADAPAVREMRRAGYQRLDGPVIQVMADAGAPAEGAFGLTACGQPLAIEVVCGRDRLITNSGWTPEAGGPLDLRLAAAGSTAVIGGGAVGTPLAGVLAKALGPRLNGGPRRVVVHRHEGDTGVWVEMEHDGWASRYGLTHERRLFLDLMRGELRGEDRFVPTPTATDRTALVNIHFHLSADASATLARDQRSVLLRGASNIGWWLRNDAAEVLIAPSVHMVDGQPRHASQVLLRGRLRADHGGRVRWKLALVEPAAP